MFEAVYVIWSEEHGAWRAAGKAGYTCSIREAGRYKEKEARAIVKDADKYSPLLKEILIIDPWAGHEPLKEPQKS